MAYNYFFPYQQPYQAAPSQNNSLIWVQGEEAAKSYLVAPNSTVTLWDSERQTVYVKSADASGMPSIKVLDYTIRTPSEQQKTPLSAKTEYVTREEFESLKTQITALMEGNKDE